MTDPRDSTGIWEKIAAKLHGELDTNEEAGFSRQLSDTESLREFEKAQKIHHQLVSHGSVPHELRVKSWKAVEKGIRIISLRKIGFWIKYIAIAAAAFFAGYLLSPLRSDDRVPAYSEVTMPFGQMGQLTMSDGTRVWLNSGTTLRFPEHFAIDNRSVMLWGEAYFEVAAIRARPFTVKTTELDVEVKGTSFNLSAYREDTITEVTVIEGNVDVRDLKGKTIALLNHGQMVTKNNITNTNRLRNVGTDFYTSWIKGKIIFDDERLDQIAVKLERWFNVEISFSEEQLKSHRFTGTILKNKPVDQIMQALELLSPIGYVHQINTDGKDKITIYKVKPHG